METFRFTSTITRIERRAFISHNQFSQLAQQAAADWCEELGQQIDVQASSSIEKSIAKANEQLECSLAPADVKTVMKPLEANVLASRNRLRDHQEEFEHLLENLEFRDKLRDGMNDKWKSWNSWNSRE